MEEAYKYRRLGNYNIASNVARLIYTGGSSVLPVLSYLSRRPMLSIWLCQLIDPLVGTREGYLSTSSSYKEEEKKRGRYRGGSIYRREEAL